MSTWAEHRRRWLAIGFALGLAVALVVGSAWAAAVWADWLLLVR